MESVNAIFYEFRYYLLPEGCTVTDGAVINARRLNERECMAPDFVYGGITDETLEITDAARTFPVTVNLYTQEEYDALLLKRIKRVCPGCVRYSDDGDDTRLDGHHREISLRGTCYEREEEGTPPSYATCVEWFYGDLAEAADELAACVDGGDSAKFNKICQKCARYIVPPVRFFGEKRDGKYVAYMQCSNYSDLYLNMLAYTALSARYPETPFARAGWSVIPFIPEGANGYKGKINGDKPLGRLEKTDLSWRYDLVVNVKKGLSEKQTDKLADDAYRYLSFKIGEDRMLRVLGAVRTEEGSAELTADEICEKLREADADIPSHFPPSLPYGWESADATPYRSVSNGVTTCISLSELACDPTEAEGINFGGEFAYAYLYAPATPERYEEIYGVLSRYLCGEDSVPEPVLLKDEFNYSFMSVGACNCSYGGGEGIAFEFFVADENKFYRFMKILAPVLTAYGAKLVVVNGAGVNEFVCGVDITPAGCGESN